ncbi:hypothetical protein [Agrobacterium cavarae]|uniref:hypothetical protein n=1 Tax=Agrobacterium cavarae TaxID=2528239 RepID=UPI002FDA8E7D
MSRMREDPFWYPKHRRLAGRIEFDAFLKTVPHELKRCTKDFERFKILERIYGVTTSFSDEDRFQVNFQKRKMEVPDLDGSQLIEKGAALVYSFNALGQVAVMLYGARSNLAKMEENLIYLRIGYYSAHQLRRMMRQDIKALVAYAYFSTIDAEPTFGERMRVKFLRHFRPRDVDEKFAPARGYDLVWGALRSIVSAIAKPVGMAILIAALTVLGMDYLADFIRPK